MEYFIESKALGLTPTKDSCGYQLTWCHKYNNMANIYPRANLSNLFSISIEVPEVKPLPIKTVGERKKSSCW